MTSLYSKLIHQMIETRAIMADSAQLRWFQTEYNDEARDISDLHKTNILMHFE